jgi:phenylacetate-CoA ligase
MRCWKPNLLISYPSKILELAEAIKSQNITYNGLKGIFTSGEVMTQTERGTIEKVFGTKVYDYYSANECGMIGWECNKHSGFHVNTTDVIVEIVDCNGSSTAGEGRVVVTALSAYAMPFIRYDLGDIGKLRQGNCTCGRTTPLIEGILGRILEFIKIPDGLVNPWHFTNAIEAYPGIAQYQIVQDSDTHMQINIVKGEKFQSDIMRKVIDACSALVRYTLSIDIKIVPRLSRDKEDRYITVKNVNH